jgi:P27 family predicted phage terminase small subunit
VARGRPPKPLEKLKATQRNSTTKADGRALVPAPVQTTPDRSVPELPEGVEGRGAVEWERVWTAGFWLKRDQDWPWVEMIARGYQDIEIYRREVADMGLTVTGYAGQVVANPLLNEIRKIETSIRQCLQVLGFSPTDRAKLNLAEVKAQDAFEDFMSRKNARMPG